jgi:hypothetical protein
MGQHGTVVEDQEPINVLTPIGQGEGLSVLQPKFSLFEEDHDQAIQGVHLIGCEVVLGDDDVLLSDTGSGPSPQGHVGSVRVGPGDDDLCRSLLGDGEEELVLDFREKEVGVGIVSPLIDAKGKQVPDLLVEPLFRGPYFPDACQHLVEIVPSARILEAFVVHDEALHEVFGQVAGRPLAELGAPGGTSPGSREPES